MLTQTPSSIRSPADASNLISQLKQAKAEDKYYDVLNEIPNVRKEFGYPPCDTTSQIVGTQAVMNVLAGERYKMVTKESKALLRGEYGQLPALLTPKCARRSSETTRSSHAVRPIC